MSEVATTVAVAPVTLPNGTVLTGEMAALYQKTPEERFAEAAKARGVTVTKPESSPQFHTDQTAIHMQRGDAEQRVDRKAVEGLGKAFATLTAVQRETFRAAYEADLRSLYEGKPSPGNLRVALDKAERDARVQGALNKALADNKSPEELKQILDDALAGSQPRSPSDPRAIPGQHVTRNADGTFKAVAPGWQSHIEDGEWIGLEHLTTDDTSGYTIPHYVQGQRVNVAMLEQLKDAKAAGITQDQVNAVLHKHAVRNGWAKA